MTKMTKTNQTQTPSATTDKSAHTPEMLWHFEGRMIRGANFSAGELPTKGMVEIIVGEHNRAVLALLAQRDELLAALKHLTAEIHLGALNVRKDFSLLNAHASATKAIANAEGKAQ